MSPSLRPIARFAAALVLTTLLAGCASMSKVDSGERTVGERLVMTLEGAWNQISAPGLGPAQTWTMEGLPVDQLLVYSGLRDGQAVHAEGAGGQGRKSFVFRATMQPDEIVALFEGMLTRDGSTFRLVKLEPAAFAGGRGFRFEYALTRKFDGVQLSGLGYGVVDKGELFALVYLAPRLAFFARHQGRVEQIARSARMKI
jgi:hypothetical protein